VNEAFGNDLRALSLDVQQDELHRTANTQPALVATTIAALRAAEEAIASHERKLEKETLDRLIEARNTGGRGVTGVHPSPVHTISLHQLRDVVHPRVVRAQLTQPDQAQREPRTVAGQPARPVKAKAAQRRDLVNDLLGIQVDSAVAVEDLLSQHADRVLLCEHHPVGRPAQRPQADPATTEPEQIPSRPRAEREVDQPAR